MGGGRDDQRLSNVRQEAAEMRIRVSAVYLVLQLFWIKCLLPDQDRISDLFL